MSDMHTIDCEEALRRLFEFLDAELHGTPQQEISSISRAVEGASPGSSSRDG